MNGGGVLDLDGLLSMGSDVVLKIIPGALGGEAEHVRVLVIRGIFEHEVRLGQDCSHRRFCHEDLRATFQPVREDRRLRMFPDIDTPQDATAETNIHAQDRQTVFRDPVYTACMSMVRKSSPSTMVRPPSVTGCLSATPNCSVTDQYLSPSHNCQGCMHEDNR